MESLADKHREAIDSSECGNSIKNRVFNLVTDKCLKLWEQRPQRLLKNINGKLSLCILHLPRPCKTNLALDMSNSPFVTLEKLLQVFECGLL